MTGSPTQHGSIVRACLLALLLAVPVPAALASDARQTPVFDSLPGVRPEDPLGEASATRCEQVLIDRAQGNILPNRGPRYRTVNVCRRDGGPEFVSPRLPPSNYRQLRGFNY